MARYYMVPQRSRSMNSYRPVEFNGGRRLPVDVRMEADAYEVVAAVPGLSIEDIKVEILDDVLTLSGSVAPLDGEGDYLLREVRFGPFSRSLRFTQPVDAAKAEAQVENGVLKVRVPKAEEAKPKVIKIKAS